MDRSLRLPAATLGALAARTLIRPRARLCLSTLRDTVVRSVVERALDSAIAADLSRPPAHAPSALAPAQAPAAGSAAFGGSRGSSLPSWVTGGGGTGVAGDSGEADALTWKSMVVRVTRNVRQRTVSCSPIVAVHHIGASDG